MSRVVPEHLLRCSDILWDEERRSGDMGIKHIVDLMTENSDKFVFKRYGYIDILKQTDTRDLAIFLNCGGWELISSWLIDAILYDRWDFIQDLLELLLMCPVDIDLLKTGNSVKYVKGLSRDKVHGKVRILAGMLVEQWLQIVKKDNETETSLQQEESEHCVKEELPETIDDEENLQEIIADVSLLNDDVENASFHALILNEQLKNVEESIVETKECIGKILREVHKNEQTLNAEYADIDNCSENILVDCEEKENAHDEENNMEVNSGEVKDARNHNGSISSPETINSNSHSASSSLAPFDSDTDKNLNKNDRRDNVKERQTINKRRSPEAKKESKENNKRRGFTTKRKINGQECSNDPQNNSVVLKRKKPKFEKFRILSKTSNIECITIQPTPKLMQRNGIIDSFKALAERKKQPRKTKMITPMIAPRIHVSKFTRKQSTTETKLTTNNESPMNVETSALEATFTISETPIMRESLQKYRIQKRTSTQSEMVESQKSTSEDIDIKEINSAGVNTSLHKGILRKHKHNNPKNLHWRNEDNLVDIRYFELDHSERVPASGRFGDLRQMERSSERRAVQQTRKLLIEDMMEEQTVWRTLIPVDDVKVNNFGEESHERFTQYVREITVAPVDYYNCSMIPDSPAEADQELHPLSIPVIIPLDDEENDTENNFQGTLWPEPKGDLPSAIHQQPSSTISSSVPMRMAPNYGEREPNWNTSAEEMPRGTISPHDLQPSQEQIPVPNLSIPGSSSQIFSPFPLIRPNMNLLPLGCYTNCCGSFPYATANMTGGYHTDFSNPVYASQGFYSDIVNDGRPRICRFYLQGHCNFGDSCRYQHTGRPGH